jgi:thymidylate synthase (FAD)
VLPQSMETEWIETGSLAYYARVYRQRADDHAQVEIRRLAEDVGVIVSELYPVSWEALTK